MTSQVAAEQSGLGWQWLWICFVQASILLANLGGLEEENKVASGVSLVFGLSLLSAMPKIAVLAYYLASYSIALLALFLSYLQYLRRRSHPALLFVLTTLSLTVIIIASTFMNLIDMPVGARGKSAFALINYLSASALVYLLPSFAYSVLIVKIRKLAQGFFQWLSIGCAAIAVLSFFIPLSPILGSAILGIKNGAILYSIIFVLIYRKKGKIDEELGKFLVVLSIATVCILPAIVLTELAPGILRALIPFRVEGAFFLPIPFALWGGVFLAIRLGGYLRNPDPSPDIDEALVAGYGVSPREREVLALLLQGKSYKEIMASLFISMPTVKTHVSSLYRRTGSFNKMQLARVLRKNKESPG